MFIRNFRIFVQLCVLYVFNKGNKRFAAFLRKTL